MNLIKLHDFPSYRVNNINHVLDDFFKNVSVEIKRFPFAARPCYMVKK